MWSVATIEKDGEQEGAAVREACTPAHPLRAGRYYAIDTELGLA